MSKLFYFSPKTIAGSRHFTPPRISRELIKFTAEGPWTNDSVRCLAESPAFTAPQQTSSPVIVESPGGKLLSTGNVCGVRACSRKSRSARRLPWSDGGKHSFKCTPHKQEILAQTLSFSSATPEKSIGSPLCPSVDTPHREDLLKSFQSSHKSLRILGKGTFGTVFAARYHGNVVAGKISSPHPKAQRQLMNESIMIGLQHKNIASVIKVVMPSVGLPGILVMEQVIGHSLQKLIDIGSDLRVHNKRFKYSLHIASALEYCHKHSILHLDVKPKNVLVHLILDECKLCDFGCSSVIGEAEDSSDKGTVQYLAPELLKGELPTPAADVYSLAITMWQIASGENPYDGEGTHSIIYRVAASGHRPTIPGVMSSDDTDFYSLIEICWSQNPLNRPGTELIIKKLEAMLSNDN